MTIEPYVVEGLFVSETLVSPRHPSCVSFGLVFPVRKRFVLENTFNSPIVTEVTKVTKTLDVGFTSNVLFRERYVVENTVVGSVRVARSVGCLFEVDDTKELYEYLKYLLMMDVGEDG